MKKIISLLLTCVMLLSAFSFVSSADDTDWPFTDVKETAWYYDGIEFCYYNGIVSGMTETTFVPNGTLTRAQFVQILAMFAGADLEAYKGADSGFNDVKTSHWFNAPVCWAVEQGFVAGLSETKFGPNNPITREQLARLLYLFGESQGLDMEPRADLSGFTDESKISDWAYEQVQWAVAAGIISGMTETTVAPRATATRAQACRMIMSYVDYMLYGVRDMSGAYAVIVEYIKANGEYFPDESYYSYYREYTGYAIVMEYVESDRSISIVYLTEPYEYEEAGETFTSFREQSSLYAYTLGSNYDFMYSYENANGTDYMYTYGYLGLDSYEVYEESVEGYENAELTERSTKAQKYITEHIAIILAEADMTLEDFFLPVELEGVFADLAAFVMEYGGTDGTGWYLYNGEGGYGVSYDENSQSFMFDYSDTVAEYPGLATKQEYAGMFIEPISTAYSYEYDIYDYTTDEPKNASFRGEISPDGYTEYEYTVTQGSEEVIRARFDEITAGLLNFIEELLNEIGYTYSDLFEVDTDKLMYDMLVDYVCANGVEDTEKGVIDLVKDEGDKAYVAEYEIATDTLYFVYVSEPKAGGTDVFDTEYCEKAVLALTYPLEDDEVFIYSYEKEDGTRIIHGTATTDGIELLIGEFDYTGYDRLTAENKINRAFNEVMSYYDELFECLFDAEAIM